MGLVLRTLDRPLLTLDRRLLTTDRRLLTPDPNLPAGEEPEDQPMSVPNHLRMPLSEFLLEANHLAGVVSRNAERMRAASAGRIGADTAEEMQRLLQEILRLGREREQRVMGPIRPLVRRAERLVSEIRAAATVVALENPIVAEQLRRVRGGARQRSALAAAWGLEMHLGLLRGHHREFVEALGAGFVEEAATTLTEIEQHRVARRARMEASAEQTATRDRLVADLQALVSEARKVASFIARSRFQNDAPKRANRGSKVTMTGGAPIRDADS